MASFFCAAYQAGNPSSVVTDLPCTAETGVTQDRVSTPLTSTEQEPHCASPQPNRGPCKQQFVRQTYSSGVSGADSTVHDFSLTRIFSSAWIFRVFQIISRTRLHADASFCAISVLPSQILQFVVDFPTIPTPITFKIPSPGR